MKGTQTDCKIFADTIEDSAREQIGTFLDHSAFKGCKTRFMPDIHTGKGAVIGTTVELSDKIIPNVTGVDLGCGMLSVKLATKDLDLPTLDKVIKETVPSGHHIHDCRQNMPVFFLDSIHRVCRDISIDPARVEKSLGTLGGGNHFIELGRDEEGYLWLTIHTGSRNFGLQVAKFHQKIAVENTNNRGVDISSIPPKERETYLKNLKRETIPKGMEYLEGELANNYIKDVWVAQEFASWNRVRISINILSALEEELDLPEYALNKLINVEAVESVHNYIDLDNRIIRKGAISAQKGEPVVIPWNMRDGLIIGEGLGNPDWNYSAPHGAGRNFSRTKAKETFSMDEFRSSMEGIYSSSIVESTLDESPMAYKDYKEVEKHLAESVKIVHRVKPIYNFKAK